MSLRRVALAEALGVSATVESKPGGGGALVGTREVARAVLGGMPPAEFAAKVKSDHDRWGRVIRDAGIKLD